MVLINKKFEVWGGRGGGYPALISIQHYFRCVCNYKCCIEFDVDFICQSQVQQLSFRYTVDLHQIRESTFQNAILASKKVKCWIPKLLEASSL